MRKITANILRLKVSLQPKSDEQLKKINTSKLTIDQLKVDLLKRQLSTTHKVKKTLVDRLLNYLYENSPNAT